jgi:iron complex transport system permease protein
VSSRRRFSVVVALLAALLVAAVTAGVTFGSVNLAPSLVWRIVLHETFGIGEATWPGNERAIVWEIRLPRALLGVVVGAGLAVVGVAVQAMVRNSLADPFLLGVSSGASTGAVIAIFTGITVFGVTSTTGFAFVGAVLALVLVFVLAHRRGTTSPLRMILAGVAVSYWLSGLSSVIVLASDDPQKNASVLFWLLGSLAKANWEFLRLPALGVVIGTVLLLLWGRRLNALLFGDETASSLGIDVARFRRQLLLVSALVTAVVCAIAGPIGFVGLLVPHVARMLVGSDHHRVIPVAALLGGVFLVVTDLIGRLALAPSELPVGAVTAIVGAPLLVALLARTERLGRIGA